MFYLHQTNIGYYSPTTFGGCHPINLLIVWLFVVLLTGCQVAPIPVDGAQTDSTATMPTSAQEEQIVDESTGLVDDQNVAESEEISDTDGQIDTEADRTTTQFLPPLRMVIPALDFATSVEAMAWQVTEVEGQRRAIWQVPESNAGWHINSAGVGAADNIIISGHHRQGTAVFAPLARGEVAIDDEIYLSDEAGRTYVYQVTELAQPIPIVGATQAERERLTAYQAASGEGQLTLLTGWPDFSDTHYLVIVAKLIGELE